MCVHVEGNLPPEQPVLHDDAVSARKVEPRSPWVAADPSPEGHIVEEALEGSVGAENPPE